MIANLLVPIDSVFWHSLALEVLAQFLRNDWEDILESLSPCCFIGSGGHYVGI